MKRITLGILTVALTSLLGACGGGQTDGQSRTQETGAQLSGTVAIDGSSTVFPITEAVAEEFQKLHPRVRVTVGISGTGGGFKKFTNGETDITDASRPIKAKEMAKASEHGVDYVELPIAFDGLSVLVHPDNTFVDKLTVAELQKIWQPGSTVKLWSDVRPGWPSHPIRLYGPGTDSGTFDYFTETINGKSQACRADFTASEDDNVLVQGIAGDDNALGFFGYSYYAENKDRLKLVPIDPGDGNAVIPTAETINNGSYAPLSRPIFIYVATASAKRPEVQAFVDFYLEHAAALAAEVGYVALSDQAYTLDKARFAGRVPGSVFGDRRPGASIEELVAMGVPGN